MGLRYPNPQLEQGAKVFRFQCSVCHTFDGADGLVERTRSWGLDQKRRKVAQLQRTAPFMPPFAGTASEAEALVQLFCWRGAGMPSTWPASEDPAVPSRIQAWLDEAGTGPDPAVQEQPR